MDAPRNFGQLLTAVVKHLFETPVIASSLKELLFSDDDNVTLTDVVNLFEKSRDILSKAAVEDMDVGPFESLVLSLEGLTDNQKDLFVKFWKMQKTKIHESAYKQTRWNNSLTKIAWRIDVKTRSKSTSEINEPTAIVEMNTEGAFIKQKTSSTSTSQPSSSSKLIRFEMDRDQLSEVLSQINHVQQSIAALTQ
eukprot:TRINITY_DN618_c0_g1_i1.p1 TRINITY_DN618_c0_g1~~TRINITY_DN618_c0_g1_i1.p1  ORF type:complete len:194 (+),score=48.45 TRINITY_DN618_c0_g1_i1:17-598(+)